MTSTIVEDKAGVNISVGVDVGDIITPEVQGTPEEIYTIFHALKDFTFREDDIMLCTYSKTAKNGLCMCEEGTVSVNFAKRVPIWICTVINGNIAVTYGKYTDYLKEWEAAINEGLEFPLHILYFEDIKLNGAKELDRLLEFLEVDLDNKLKSDVLDACSFERMSKEKAIVPKEFLDRAFHQGFNFFRKGKVADWKNWFTVAQNEFFDELWNREMKDSKMFTFTYTG